jgi:hypothetical protein
MCNALETARYLFQERIEERCDLTALMTDNKPLMLHPEFYQVVYLRRIIYILFFRFKAGYIESFSVKTSLAIPVSFHITNMSLCETINTVSCSANEKA